MSVQNLECYLYELAQCFEGFAKATLLLLLLGLTAIISMLYSIMSKLATAEQQRGTASTVAPAQLSSLADAGGEETSTSESEKEIKPKKTSLKKQKNNTAREDRTTGKSKENAKYKKQEKNKKEKENNDVARDRTTTSESEEKTKRTKTKKNKSEKENYDATIEDTTTGESEEEAKHKKTKKIKRENENNDATGEEKATGESEETAKQKQTKKNKWEEENNGAAREETATSEIEKETKLKKSKKLQRKNEKNTKLDDSDKNTEDSKKSEKDDSKEDNDSNAGKAENVKTYAKNPLRGTHDKVSDEIPCGLTNPPCDCEEAVLCDHKRTKRQAKKIGRDGGMTKSPLSSRPSLVCTPSNCSLNSKNCLSHLPECTSNGQIYTCRKFKRKLSCCSDCCEH